MFKVGDIVYIPEKLSVHNTSMILMRDTNSFIGEIIKVKYSDLFDEYATVKVLSYSDKKEINRNIGIRKKCLVVFNPDTLKNIPNALIKKIMLESLIKN